MLRRSCTNVMALLATVLMLLQDREFSGVGQDNTPASEIYFPQEHGTIEEIHQGSGDKLVVLIEDAHANEMAQQNISKIVAALQKHHGMAMVGLEGSSGFVDTTLFEYFPGAKAKEIVSEFLLRRGKITGAELASIRSSAPLSLFGIEDPKTYLANYDSLVRSTAERKNALDALAILQKQVQQVTDAVYSPAQKESEAAWQDFIRGKIPPSVAHASLENRARENAVSTAHFKHFGLYQQLLELEKNLDLARADQARSQAVVALSKILGRSELKGLTQKALRYREGSLSGLEFHRQLMAFLAKHQMVFPALASYAEYLEIANGVDRNGLRRDMEELSGLIFEKIADRKALQTRARRIAKLFGLADKFLRLRAPREDYLFFRREFPADAAAALAGLAQSLCRQANVPLDIPPDRIGVLQAGLQKAQVFYSLAVQRDQILAANLVGEMDRAGKNRSILLAGGFHADGITQYFKAQGISYVVVLPNVGNEPTEERYMALLMRKDTPYMDIYRKTKKTDVLSGAIGWVLPGVNRDEGLALAMVSLFKNLIPGFEALQEDFQIGYVSQLVAVATATGESKDYKIPEAWKDHFQLSYATSPSDFYIPTKIGHVFYIYHFYGPGINPDTEKPVWSLTDLKVGNLEVQVMDIAAFGRVRNRKFGLVKMELRREIDQAAGAIQKALESL